MLLSKQNKSLLISLLVASIGNIESFAPTYTSRVGIASVQQTPINQNAFQTTTSNSLVSPTSSTSLSALSFLDEETTQKLIVLSFEKLIDAGIPSIFFIITSWWFISQFRNQDGGNSMSMRGGCRKGRGSRRGGRGRMGFVDPNERPLGPVEELYDDIYDDLSGPQQDVPPLLKLLGGVTLSLYRLLIHRLFDTISVDNGSCILLNSWNGTPRSDG